MLHITLQFQFSQIWWHCYIVLENTIPWMWKSNCTHCANWHFSSHCSDEAQFTPSGHLLGPDSRQGRQAGPVGICKTHILSMCTAILSDFTKPTLVRRQDAEIAYAIQENFEYCTIWINSIVSCFNSLINWTTIMNMYKTYWWPHADRHDP